MDSKVSCRNCGHTFQGEYCSRCGQKVFARFTHSYLWHGLREDLFEIENGLLLTFRELWVHPGNMVLKYIHGKTKRYYSPLKYLIFWTAIYFIVIQFTTQAEPGDFKKLIVNSNAPFSTESFNDFVVFWFYLMQKQTDIYFLGLIPFLAVFNFAFHRNKGFNLTEILILHTYFCGQFTFVAIITTLFVTWLSSFEFINFLLTMAFYLSYFYLFTKMQKEFFRESWKTGIVNGLLIYFLGLLSFLSFLFIIFNGMKYALR